MSQKVYTEEWRPVVGYEGLYEVSNLGQVKSLDRVVNAKNGSTAVKRGKIMSIHTRKEDGRKDIMLCGKDGHKRLKIHRLVAMAFLPNPENFPEVNHKDENPSNNAVWNLEWCDRWYNTHYGRYSEKISEKLSVPVLQIKDGVIIKRWKSTVDASRYFSVNGNGTGNIWFALKGATKTAYGYEWRYA